jgi:hypothetical protein
MSASTATPGQSEFVSRVLHDFAQPVTALECGLELALLQDKTVDEFHARLRKLLGITQALHVRLLELRDTQSTSAQLDGKG